MKTKNLLTSVALSAMFAACTQDAELNEAIAKNDFSDVPMVEARFTASTGAESKMARQYEFELEDVIGFAWMGKETSSYTGEAWANYPLYCSDADAKEFKGESTYYVGKYFAYMPYSDDVKSVDYIPFSVENQTLSTNIHDYAKHAIYISPKVIELKDDEDADYKAGRKTNIALKMKELSNVAQIKLSFKNAENLNDLAVKKLTIDLVSTLSDNSKASILPLSFDFKPNATNAKDSWDEVESSVFYSNFVGGGVEIGALTLDNEDGISVEDGELTTYAVVLPVSSLDIGSKLVLNVSAETSYGTINAKNVKVIAQGKTEADAAAVSSSTELFTKFDKTGTIVADLDIKDIKLNAPTVKTQSELNNVLENLIALNYTSKAAITLDAQGAETFVLTDFQMPEDLEALVTLKTNAKNGIVFEGEETIIDKVLTLGSKATVKGILTVNAIKDYKDAVLTVKTLVIDNDAELVNNAYIAGSIETTAADADKGLAAGLYVHNSENSKLDKKELNNKGEAEWTLGASSVPTLASGSNKFFAKVTSYKDMMAAATAKVTVVRIMDNYIFSNDNTELSVGGIEAVECYGSAAFAVEGNSYNGGTTVSFPALKTITVKGGGSMTVRSSEIFNSELNTFAWYDGANVTVEKEGYFSLQNINVNKTEIVNNGTVNLWNVVGTVNKKTNNGNYTSIENKD